MSENTRTDRIIVGVDGSRESIAALTRGSELAAALHAPLEMITTWQYPAMVGYAFESATGWSPEGDAVAIQQDAIAAAFGEHAPPLTRTVMEGPPARVLIHESSTAAMLVLGSRGRGGFFGLLLGSVSAACAEHAHCPVLIMHQAEAAAA